MVCSLISIFKAFINRVIARSKVAKGCRSVKRPAMARGTGTLNHLEKLIGTVVLRLLEFGL